MKKLLALALALVMVLSLAACGGNTTETKGAETETKAAEAVKDVVETVAGEEAPEAIALDGTWPEETVKIGFLSFDTTADQHLACMDYFDYLSKYFNIEVISSESIADAEGELNFINDCAAAGCKAIIAYYNVSLAEAAKACSAQGMYYWGGFGGDEAAYNEVKDDPYYLGGYTLGDAEYNAGYSLGKAITEQGCEKIVYCSGGAAFGVSMFIDRQQGFLDALAEANLEPVKIIEGWPGTDAFAAEQTATLDMDIDAIVSSFAIAMWFQPLMNSPKAETVKLAAIATVDDLHYDFFNNGTVVGLVYDCEEVVFGNAIPMILSAVTGAKYTNEDGSAPLVPVHRWTVTTPEQYNAIYDIHSAGEYVITAEDIAALIPAVNADATSQGFVDYYASWDIDKVLE